MLVISSARSLKRHIHAHFCEQTTIRQVLFYFNLYYKFNCLSQLGEFLEEFIKQSLLPLTVPINHETLKMLREETRKIVLTIVQDEMHKNSAQLIRVLRSAANANRDLIFSFVGVKQWEEFADGFDATKSAQLPKVVVWDGNEEYELVRLF